MAEDFDGKIVVVTGASTGLGRAIALEVAGRGAKAVVVNFASSADEAEITAGLVREKGAEAMLVRADVGEDDGCKAIAKAAAGYGRVDALFNNAGITRFARDHSDMDAISMDDFLAIYRIGFYIPLPIQTRKDYSFRM